jgi:RWD domain
MSGTAERAHEQVETSSCLFAEWPGLDRVSSERGLSDADVAQLQAAVDAAVEENLGMAMVYGLVTAAQEWLTDKVRPTA